MATGQGLHDLAGLYQNMINATAALTALGTLAQTVDAATARYNAAVAARDTAVLAFGTAMANAQTDASLAIAQANLA